MSIGTGVHYAAEVNHRQKIDSGMDMRLSDIQDAAADGFYQDVEKNGVYFTGNRAELMKELGKAQDLSIKLAGKYLSEVAPQIMPVAAEMKIEAQHPELPIPFSGTVDVVDAKDICLDLKTARQKWRSGKERETTQPAIYRWMLKQHFGHDYGFGFHVLTHNGGTQFISVEASDHEMAPVIGIAKAMLNSIYSGCFMPAVPGHWICQEKFCGYIHSCPYKK